LQSQQLHRSPDHAGGSNDGETHDYAVPFGYPCVLKRLLKSSGSSTSCVADISEIRGAVWPGHKTQADPLSATGRSRMSLTRRELTDPSVMMNAALSHLPPGAALPALAGEYARRRFAHPSGSV
jgi:hypothetical protein